MPGDDLLDLPVKKQEIAVVEGDVSARVPDHNHTV